MPNTTARRVKVKHRKGQSRLRRTNKFIGVRTLSWGQQVRSKGVGRKARKTSG